MQLTTRLLAQLGLLLCIPSVEVDDCVRKDYGAACMTSGVDLTAREGRCARDVLTVCWEPGSRLQTWKKVA